MIAFLSCGCDSTTRRTIQTRRTTTTKTTTTKTTTTTTKTTTRPTTTIVFANVDIVDRYHQDMERILQTKRDLWVAHTKHYKNHHDHQHDEYYNNYYYNKNPVDQYQQQQEDKSSSSTNHHHNNNNKTNHDLNYHAEYWIRPDSTTTTSSSNSHLVQRRRRRKTTIPSYSYYTPFAPWFFVPSSSSPPWQYKNNHHSHHHNNNNYNRNNNQNPFFKNNRNNNTWLSSPSSLSSLQSSSGSIPLLSFQFWSQLRQLDRKHRPPIVSHDFDGAEHVHAMLIQTVLPQQQQQYNLQQQYNPQQSSTETTTIMRTNHNNNINNNNNNNTWMLLQKLSKSYEIVMQAYLQRGRLRWFNDDHDMNPVVNHNNHNNNHNNNQEEEYLGNDEHYYGHSNHETTTTTTATTCTNNNNKVVVQRNYNNNDDDTTIDILFDTNFDDEDDDNNDKNKNNNNKEDKEEENGIPFLVGRSRQQQQQQSQHRTVVCAADVLNDLYQQWQWDKYQLGLATSATTPATTTQSEQHAMNENNKNKNDQYYYKNENDDDDDYHPIIHDNKNDSSLLWNPISACWLASQAICATPRGGNNRNYAQRALDFVNMLRQRQRKKQEQKQEQQQYEQQELSTVPVEALLYGIHAAAWQQGGTKRRRRIQSKQQPTKDDDDENNDDEYNDEEDWAPQAYELWKELIEILHQQPSQIYTNTTKTTMTRNLSFLANQTTTLDNNHDNNNNENSHDFQTRQEEEDHEVLSHDGATTTRAAVLEICLLASAWTIEAWSKSAIPGSAQKAQEILDQMIAWNVSLATTTTTTTSSSSSKGISTTPTTTTTASTTRNVDNDNNDNKHYSDKTRTSTNSESSSSDDEHVVSSPVACHNHVHALLDTEVYSNVIIAWCKDGAPDRAQALLEEMIALYERRGLFVVGKEDDKDDDDDDESRQIIQPQENLKEQNHPTLLPTIAFNSVIAAWGKKGNTAKAIQVLQRMHKLSQIRHSSTTTTTVQAGREKGDGLRTMVAEPNTISYNTVLSSLYQQSFNNNKNDKKKNNNNNNNHSRCDYEMILSNAKKALLLVRYMEDNQNVHPSIRPNAFTYHTLIRILLVSITATTGTPKSIMARTRTTTMTTTTKEQQQQQDTRVSILLSRIHRALIQVDRLWRRGDRSVEPSNRIFNMVINAYAKSTNFVVRQDATRVAFELMEQMKHSQHVVQQPDIVTLTSVMECLSKHNASSALPLSSSSSSFSTITTTDPPSSMTLSTRRQALDLVDQAMTNYKETQRSELRPNVRFFTMAIRTLSLHYGTVQEARSVLTQLIELYKESPEDDDLTPNAYPYNYVLNCAANSLISTPQEKREVFLLATQTYQEIRQSPYQTVQPDSYTYGFWLKCCNSLLDSNQPQQAELKENCIRYAFEECKDRGLVTKEILTRLYQGCTTKLVHELLQFGTILDYGGSDDARSGGGGGLVGHDKTWSLSSSSSSSFSSSSYQPLPQISDLPYLWSRNADSKKSKRKTNKKKW